MCVLKKKRNKKSNIRACDPDYNTRYVYSISTQHHQYVKVERQVCQSYATVFLVEMILQTNDFAKVLFLLDFLLYLRQNHQTVNAGIEILHYLFCVCV